MKAASSSQRVGDTRPCACGPCRALHGVRAGSRPAVALPAGGVGGSICLQLLCRGQFRWRLPGGCVLPRPHLQGLGSQAG